MNLCNPQIATTNGHEIIDQILEQHLDLPKRHFPCSSLDQKAYISKADRDCRTSLTPQVDCWAIVSTPAKRIAGWQIHLQARSDG
eukprot:scaffold129843_cov15-Prasinocladus_malaysianus.AAC.1